MIRNLKETDIDQIMKIWLDTNIKAHYFIDSSYWLKSYVTVEKVLPQAIVYVYDSNGQIQGFLGLNGDYIEGIFVDADYQSKGIGRELLGYAKERHNKLLLNVYKRNERAAAFYLREGFVVMTEQIEEDTKERELTMVWNPIETENIAYK
ncbi:GNAT family N-acetyltransferase [Lacrimispora sphenoides]|uniref:Acetyltransferase n=1 Tax=Lacrimispora sphenoides JCM 1415 TaxID=1297793 RepID=A0ABY1C9Y2_9FIRM|nr:GNAT family N-acetyltransferase [Lacrimispora sphenoides]SET84348.1 putative acetyltransferase [[Clostridium] sphenoides JCM 1415]SUY51698.1 acetyltransferase [Lacrimispora sphenoides]